MIKTIDLQKIFKTEEVETWALNNVSIEVKQGEFVAIMGPSGCGKSTLLNILGLLDNPTGGEYYLNGTEVSRYTESQRTSLRKGVIGFVFQSFNLIDELNVYENIELPLLYMGISAAERKKRVESAMERMAITHRSKHFPQQLSGGQQQRVAIARALASDPKVLLCDEATSALDPATTQAILKLLKEINRTLGITILLITHEMEVVKRICDRVAVIDKGKLIEQGSVSEIFSNPKTELAQDFIRSTFHISLPEEYLEGLTDTPKHDKAYPIIKFEFTGRSVDAPLLSQASKKFGVELSILNSQIDYAGGVKFGYTIAEVEGSEDAITQTKIYLMENNVRVEVLGYVQ